MRDKVAKFNFAQKWTKVHFCNDPFNFGRETQSAV